MMPFCLVSMAKTGFAGLEGESGFGVAGTADHREDFPADLVDVMIAPLHDHRRVLERLQEFLDLRVGHAFGSAMPSVVRARLRWVSLMCRETKPMAIASTAASSVKPKPAMKSGTASNGITK